MVGNPNHDEKGRFASGDETFEHDNREEAETVALIFAKTGKILN
jgi:hypothetical protein